MRIGNLLFISFSVVHGFVSRNGDSSLRLGSLKLQSHSIDHDEEKKNAHNQHPRKRGPNMFSRRDACIATIGGASGLIVGTEKGRADDRTPLAVRPCAYRVDSTQPPTLIPLTDARKEIKVLTDLGKGLGTSKEAILDDRVNLNNMLNKAVFGTIDTFASLSGQKESDTPAGNGYSSYVCLGVPSRTTPVDIDLATSLLSNIVRARDPRSTALGLSMCPLSAQSDLDAFLQSGNELDLINALAEKGVVEETTKLYMPLLRYAKDKSLALLALSPEFSDIKTARMEGLQNVSLERRASYVADTEGFVALSQAPKFRLYTDRSLLKDFEPLSNNDKPGDFFAERILVHETAATVAATYGSNRPDSLVAMVAPIPDVRFLGGINGRIPRICEFLNQDSNKVTNDAVTTILLNPTAQETLSQSRFLRLEIGTGPETLDLQTKVADYLWFSSSPKVNLIPRLMNA